MSSVAGLESEYRTITERAGLLDRSDRGKLALSGPDAKPFLQGQVTNDVERLTPGEGCYAAFLTPKGKMLGDLRVLDAGQELLLDTERVALQPLFNLIRHFSIGYQLQLHKRTLECGLLSIIGPQWSSVVFAPQPEAREHSHQPVVIGDVPARASRTDIGVDLLCEAAAVAALKDVLLEAGVEEVSEQVADCLRVEHGRPRYGVDLDETVIPQEAGLNERAVSFTKGCYVGQETVARLHYRGRPNRQLRGLRLSGSATYGDPVLLEGKVVGHCKSVAESPSLGPIALAFVRREVAPGAQVLVARPTDLSSSAGSEATGATVVELPFA